ncbi:uncharacterized protein LOC118477950 [Aplysia californica]|uniref:Uncharacterized protein LOC118477950 n=1 Tax=Aplysia californica TaxID=6500 RepID=A0ABM1VW20_APLCA|nr:uncharacterized protein LOC118477950 [Aplysia californica]
MADLSLFQGLEVERVYYGSEHGKGEADGETGVLSQQVRKAVLGGQVNIRHANDLFKWASENLSVKKEFSARTFFLISDISRDRPETSIKTRRHQEVPSGPTTGRLLFKEQTADMFLHCVQTQLAQLLCQLTVCRSLD